MNNRQVINVKFGILYVFEIVEYNYEKMLFGHLEVLANVIISFDN